LHLRPARIALQNVHRLVLGGLVEETWPPEAIRSVAQPADAAGDRPRLPERRIGLSAHDFAQRVGAPQIS